MTSIKFIAKTDRFFEALERAKSAPVEVRMAILDGLERGEELVTIEVDRDPARRTDEVVIRFDPSDWLVDLLAAGVAGNG